MHLLKVTNNLIAIKQNGKYLRHFIPALFNENSPFTSSYLIWSNQVDRFDRPKYYFFNCICDYQLTKCGIRNRSTC